MHILNALLALCLGQVPQAPPVVHMAQAPPMHSCATAMAQACDEGKPVALFVGVKARPVRGFVVHQYTEAQDQSPRILVLAPKRGVQGTALILSANSSNAVIIERGSGLLPRPFLKRLFRKEGKPLIADADGLAAGPWPKTVEWNDKLVLYKPAEWTQEIATTNNSPRISPVHRSALPSKWHQPGGMEGIEGWRSDLYKFIPDGWQREWTARIPVFNGSNDQFELGWTRVYPDGTEFHDVLSNTDSGEVFEHRTARKQDGAWQRFVSFRNKDAYPAGYNGLKGVSCATCHNATDGAGTGGYASALVPGADTILSDPFPKLER